MFTYQNPKLSQYTRQQIFNCYQEKDLIYNSKGQIIKTKKKYTQGDLAQRFNISRQTVSKIIRQGKMDQFTPQKPINHRYQTFTYWNKRVDKIIDKKDKDKLKQEKKQTMLNSRYEHKQAGDLGHIDLKLLPPIIGEKIVKGQKEYLLTIIDDSTREARFEIIQGKNQHQVRKGLIRTFQRSNIEFKRILSDNGKEFKGAQKQVETTGRHRAKTKQEGQRHQVELLLEEMNIKHSYTQVRRPQTNGKVERLNRTISDEFLTRMKFENRLHREAQLRLWEYHYNLHRPHQGINKMTPNQKLQTQSYPLKFLT